MRLGELEGHDVLVDAKVRKARGVHVAHPAKQLAASIDLGRPTRLQPGVLGRVCHLEADLRDAQGRKQTLDNALRVKEVERLVPLVPTVEAPGTAEHAGNVARLVGKRALLMAKEDATLLIERDVGHAVVQVVGNGAQQARQDGAAHLGVVGEQRVLDAHGHAAAGLGDVGALEVAILGEAVRERLGQAAGTQRAPDELGALLVDREAAVVVLGRGQRGLHAIHAPQAQDLLDEVGLAREVRTARGGHDLEVVAALLGHDGASQALEQVADLIVGDGRAAHAAHALTAKGDADGLHGHGILVHAATADGGAAAALEQCGGDVGDLLAVRSVNLALKADGRLAHEVEVAARARDVALVEAGALEQDVDRGVVNL